MKLIKILLAFSVILNIILVNGYFEPFRNNGVTATKNLPVKAELNTSDTFSEQNRNLSQTLGELRPEDANITAVDKPNESLESYDILSTVNLTEQALTVYRKYLKGDLLFQNDKITIPYEDNRDNDVDEIPLDKYALFDMNGDDLPELHTLSWQGYDIFTYKNGEMLHWYWANSYTQPLNNKAVLMTHLGGSNSTTHYAYHVLDFYGSRLLRVDFFCSFKNFDKSPSVYDETSRYFFEEVEVTMEEWHMLTDKYLSVGTDQIEWHTPDEENFPYF